MDKDIFEKIVFPEIIDSLQQEKSKKQYLQIKNNIEVLSGKPFVELTEEDGRNFAETLKKSGYASSTICIRMAIIRAIASFCEKFDDSKYKNPFINLCKEYEMNSYIDESKIPSRSELKTFIDECPPRIRLITTLTASLGLSTRDLTVLKVSDIHIDNTSKEKNAYLLLRKNAYARYLYLPSDIKEQIERYIQYSGLNPNGYVFFSSVSNKNVSVRTMERWYKSEADKQTFNYTLQDLRNAAASYMIASGADVDDVQQALGLTQQMAFRYNKCVDKIIRCDATKYV